MHEKWYDTWRNLIKDTSEEDKKTYPKNMLEMLQEIRERFIAEYKKLSFWDRFKARKEKNAKLYFFDNLEDTIDLYEVVDALRVHGENAEKSKSANAIKEHVDAINTRIEEMEHEKQERDRRKQAELKRKKAVRVSFSGDPRDLKEHHYHVLDFGPDAFSFEFNRSKNE